MSAESDRIRKMQADGKITKEQAEKLLKALSGSTLQNPKRPSGSIRTIVLISSATLFLAGVVAAVVHYTDKSVTARDVSTSLQETTAGGQNENLNGRSRAPAEYRISEVPMEYVASQGELLFLNGDKKLSLPLMHTDVVGRVDGYLARVNVTQSFVNLFDSTIEAIYTFPLPENAAVDSMIMTIGDHRIKGIIKERGEARAVYEQARRDGKTASLLEQERPNIFTQSVANILKGDTILVTISYVQELTFKNGSYVFNFPMVVGPRYIPGAAIKPAVNGTVNPSSQVPDADKITPPLVPPTLRSGHDIALTLTINAGTEITELSSASHKTNTRLNSDKTHTVTILQNDNIPNKDFIVEYSAAKKEIGTVVLCHREKDDGFFQLMMMPKVATAQSEIFPRELVFVVDNSGSMQGYPIEKCKELISLCLKQMRSSDVFRVMKFAGSTEEMSPMPLAASSDNVENALSYVEQMRGGGGTEMLTAIKAIFDTPQTKGRRRLVFFLTDGYIGNEAAILTTIRNKLGTSRVFGCGVGSSVNSYLIEGMAYNGRGVSIFMRQDGDAGKAMREFYSYIDAPVLTDIEVKFNDLAITETAPRYLPDLFAGQPLVITGKYSTPGSGNLVITGNLPGGRTYSTTVDVNLPQKEEANSIIANLWARKKIAEIELRGSGMMEDRAFTPDSVKEQVTRLGLAYRIMTSFTSFVAVDDAIRNKSGVWTTKVQAVDLPEGVNPASQPAKRYAAGNPRSRATKKGVLSIISGQIERKSGSSQDIFGNGGSATNIDEILQGVGGLKAGGSNGVGRKGAAGIGYGAGYGSGFGGSGSSDSSIGLNNKKGGSLRISAPEFSMGSTIKGARSKESILRVVMQNLASIRYAYNKRLGEKPDLKGKITVKFSIDQFGKVIFCQVVESTMGDPKLETIITEKVKRWVFEKIDNPGDVTEVVYPFVFSQ